MLVSQFFLATLKESPANAEVISHQLMIRSGMIRRLASGLYTWLPLGLRVLQNVITIIRQEMNKSRALEIFMPFLQPAELWIETERWDKFGPQLLKISDRHSRDFCFGPTHEEIITDLARRELRSYKQLPINFYQIQTKFRDEIRPRFGVMRSREFLMKDAYSFHLDDASLQETYQIMYDTYSRIFTRLGLNFRAVLADTGSIGGNFSHEFQVLADSGEDIIAHSDQSNYAANIEKAEAREPVDLRKESSNPIEKISTPGLETIAALSDKLNIPANKSVKTLLVKGNQSPLVALILRGDHELNPLKAEKLPEIKSPLEFVDKSEIEDHIKAKAGSIGPVNLEFPIIADRDAAVLSDFVCGANETGFHFINVNWVRDLPLPIITDLRNVVEGDLSPDGKGHLKLTQGIEVGHIFQLGDRYSQQMKAFVLDEAGQSKALKMGCYGIGVSRIVAASIEQHHDENGIIWPEAMAPFKVVIIPIQLNKSEAVKEASFNLYQRLIAAGLSVLLDDRNERPGIMFADMDLIGIPHRIVISDRGLKNGTYEYKQRSEKESQNLSIEEILQRLM